MQILSSYIRTAGAPYPAVQVVTLCASISGDAKHSLSLCEHLTLLRETPEIRSAGPVGSCEWERSGAELTILLADMSGLENLEAAGEPDEAWQRLYQRLGQQSGRSGTLGTAQVLLCLDLSIPYHLPIAFC